jgi:fused signal recognition particle receptor
MELLAQEEQPDLLASRVQRVQLVQLVLREQRVQQEQWVQ